MPASKKCLFSTDWIDEKLNPQWSSWLKQTSSNESALCSICNKTFTLSNMGIQAVKSHATGKKHLANISSKQKTINIQEFLSKKQSSGENSKNENSSVVKEIGLCVEKEKCDQGENNINVKRVTLNDFSFKNDLLKSEIYWTCGTVSSHMSIRQAESCQKLFGKMFPDSKYAENFSVYKNKHSYLATHGLYPYFKDQLTQDLCNSDFFSVSFDESLNKVAQKTQMDIHVKYLDKTTGLVATRYLTSEFLVTCKAVDLLRHLHQGLGYVKKDRMLSVAMDGPNVNWKMIQELKLELEDVPDNPELIEFGSCALHVLHGSLKTGHSASGWSVIEFLRSSYYLFNDFPSRKCSYTKITGSTKFPEKFCTTRWVGNEKACTTTIAILPHIRKYVEEIGKLPTSKVFGKVKQMLADPFLAAKLGFFQGLSHQLERFLRIFQDNRPLVPFLYDELSSLVFSLLKRILKPDIYESIKTTSDIFRIDWNKICHFKNPKDLDLYNSAKEGLRRSISKPSAPEIQR